MMAMRDRPLADGSPDAGGGGHPMRRSFSEDLDWLAGMLRWFLGEGVREFHAGASSGAADFGFFGSPSPAVARPTAFATENYLSDLTLVSTCLWLRIYESYRELLPISMDTKFGCFMGPEVTNAEAET
jgi:hypothetical protein